MVTFLEEIYSIADVRAHIEKTFKLKQIMAMNAGNNKISKHDQKKIMKNAKASLHVKNEEEKKGNHK